MIEPDWDAGTENAYEAHRARFSSGLCLVCRDTEALPDDDLCRACLIELESSAEPGPNAAPTAQGAGGSGKEPAPSALVESGAAA